MLSEWKARIRIAEFLKKECPKALELLEPAAGYISSECVTYRFAPNHRQNFDSLSESPLIDYLARAAIQIKSDIGVAIQDIATGFDHEISIRRTESGIEAVRNIRERQQPESQSEPTERLRLHA